MGYLISIITLLFIVIVLWKRGKKPYKHLGISQGDLKRFLETLLFRGYPNGMMYVELPNKVKLVFSKYLNETNSVGIQFSIPLTEGPASYGERVKAIFEDNEVGFEVKKIQKLLIVDLKQDVELGQNLARLVFENLFRLKDSDKVDLYFENVSARNEKIGF